MNKIGCPVLRFGVAISVWLSVGICMPALADRHDTGSTFEDVSAFRPMMRALAVRWAEKRKDGQSLLHLTERMSDEELDNLPNAFKKVNTTRNKAGQTLLCWVAEFGAPVYIDILLEAGADVHARSADGWTALHYATDRPEIVRKLLADGADPNAKGNNELIPLHIAARYGNLKAVDALLKAGAKVNARGEDGATPLHFAVIFGHREAVGVLLGAGANIHVKMGKRPGSTALDLARASLHKTEDSIQPYQQIIWLLQKFAQAENAPQRKRAPKPKAGSRKYAY